MHMVAALFFIIWTELLKCLFLKRVFTEGLKHVYVIGVYWRTKTVYWGTKTLFLSSNPLQGALAQQRSNNSTTLPLNETRFHLLLTVLQELLPFMYISVLETCPQSTIPPDEDLLVDCEPTRLTPLLPTGAYYPKKQHTQRALDVYQFVMVREIKKPSIY